VLEKCCRKTMSVRTSVMIRRINNPIENDLARKNTQLLFIVIILTFATYLST
jgi:hypothetical protein